MASSNDITKTGGDPYLRLFQEWYNKTYGSPTIAVDGKQSVGTQEAYARTGNAFVKYMDNKAKTEKNELAEMMSHQLQTERELGIKKARRNLFGGLAIGALVTFIIIKISK